MPGPLESPRWEDLAEFKSRRGRRWVWRCQLHSSKTMQRIESLIKKLRPILRTLEADERFKITGIHLRV